MNVIFVASTITQLMNAAQIAETEYVKERCDLLYTDNNAWLVDDYLIHGVFRAAYKKPDILDSNKRCNIVKRAYNGCRRAYALKRVIAELPVNPNQYDRIFLSGRGLCNIEVYYAFKRVNKDIRCSIYEEGNYEYTSFDRKRVGEMLFSFAAFGRYYLKDCDSLYVYQPSLVRNVWRNISLKRISPLRRSSLAAQVIQSRFEKEARALPQIRNKVILIDEACPEEADDLFQQKFVRWLARRIGIENILIKLHPFSIGNKYGTECKYLPGQYPVEYFFMGGSIQAGCTIISLYSTAVFNILNWVDNGYCAIILNELLGKRRQEEMHKYSHRFQAYYKGSNTLFIPKKKKELQEVLQRVYGTDVSKGTPGR